MLAIYTEWDEVRRPQLAKDYEVPQETYVECDLIGDIRRIRNFIVHGEARGESQPTELKELDWIIDPAGLQITGDMFRKMINGTRQMELRLREPGEFP